MCCGFSVTPKSLTTTVTEMMINEDPHVHSSIIFGHGRFQNGVLVEPVENFPVDPTDSKHLEEYRNKIW